LPIQFNNPLNIAHLFVKIALPREAYFHKGEIL
jgi:hypothetical protein